MSTLPFPADSSEIFLLPIFASAHVKWFVDPSAVLPIDPYSLADWQVLLGIMLAMVVVAIAFMLERKLLPLDKIFPSFFERINFRTASLFSIFIGIGLVIFSFNGYIFAPNIIAESSLGYAMLTLQAIIGAAFILGLRVKSASIFLLLLYLSVLIYFGGVVSKLDFAGELCFSCFSILNLNFNENLKAWKFKKIYRLSKILFLIFEFKLSV